jgi:hypothetical protein
MQSTVLPRTDDASDAGDVWIKNRAKSTHPNSRFPVKLDDLAGF